jgi:hypothetical protein
VVVRAALLERTVREKISLAAMLDICATKNKIRDTSAVQQLEFKYLQLLRC